MVPIQQSIFRDYDIRGIFPSDLNVETMFVLGQAIATYLKVQEISVGYDARLSSPELSQALIAGICEQGVNVVDLGLISTEMNYFASGYYRFPGSVIVSASHNPAQYNGLKIVKCGAVPLHGGLGLPEIKKMSLEQKFIPVHKKGTVTSKNILDDWVNHALSFINVKNIRPLKVVIDAGNGMGGIAWEKVSGKLPVKIVPLYFTPDGNFPHHLPDPLKTENLQDLKTKVISEQADLGFALDGDADRLFVLDEKGGIVTGTVTTAILSELILTKYGPKPVLYNVVCGRVVPETILALGGTPVRVRVGHSYIKTFMKEKRAIFAGEHSGHFYFGENYNADSSFIAGLLILEYLSKQNRKLSDVVRDFDKYPQSGEQNYRIKNAAAVQAEIEKEFKKSGRVDHIDGLSIFYKDWWFSLRSSNTEPLLRLNVEADNKEILEVHTGKLVSCIVERGGIRV
jgi:phosphomannomutase